MSEHFTGAHWMLATPFDQDERVDFESVSRLVEKAQESGCQGVVTLGVTGEVARLTEQERHAMVKQVVQTARGMPVTGWHHRDWH